VTALSSTLNAEDAILALCRVNSFKTRGQWGMRSDVALGGHGSIERTPCVVLDLARTKPHPTRYGHTVPVVLAAGDSWDAVLGALVAAGELGETTLRSCRA
jgi:hypothetical protein